MIVSMAAPCQIWWCSAFRYHDRTMTGKNVKVRFAPSPTAYLHLGNLRTALLNALRTFAYLTFSVIPAKAGIHSFQHATGFPHTRE